MPSLVELVRVAARLTHRAPDDQRSYLAALLVLVLFVIWLLATGQDLMTALAAAVMLSWAADSATQQRQQPIARPDGVDA